jgi:hypothetical protein
MTSPALNSDPDWNHQQAQNQKGRRHHVREDSDVRTCNLAERVEKEQEEYVEEGDDRQSHARQADGIPVELGAT